MAVDWLDDLAEKVSKATAEPERCCSIDGCDRRVWCRGWCAKHYCRWRAHGDPLVALVTQGPADNEKRFWAKVNIHGPVPGHAPQLGPCWLWLGGTDRAGYGGIHQQGKRNLAHRVAYEIVVGPIPDGFVIDHLCFVRGCVNPAHLEAVTPEENTERARRAGRFHMSAKQ